MWGSDITRCHNHNYKESLDYMLADGLLNDSEKELVMGKSLRQAYGWT
jgi:hypothetical protein